MFVCLHCFDAGLPDFFANQLRQPVQAQTSASAQEEACPALCRGLLMLLASAGESKKTKQKVTRAQPRNMWVLALPALGRDRHSCRDVGTALLSEHPGKPWVLLGRWARRRRDGDSGARQSPWGAPACPGPQPLGQKATSHRHPSIPLAPSTACSFLVLPACPPSYSGFIPLEIWATPSGIGFSLPLWICDFNFFHLMSHFHSSSSF